MEHLTLAGLLRCQQCVGGIRNVMDTRPDADNSPTNQYDGVISIWHDNEHYAIRRPVILPTLPNRLQIHTGPRIPSNILSEVDRKIDDGLANSGGMVFNQYVPMSIGGMPDFRVCMNTAAASISDDGLLDSPVIMHYRLASRGPSVEGNCGGGIFI